MSRLQAVCPTKAVKAFSGKKSINNVLQAFIKTNEEQKYFLEIFHRGQCYWQKAGIYGKWVHMDSAGESSGLTDPGQITQEAGWS